MSLTRRAIRPLQPLWRLMIAASRPGLCRVVAAARPRRRAQPECDVPPPRFEVLEPRLLLSASLHGLDDPDDPAAEASTHGALEPFGLAPALFVENRGQWDDEAVRFLLRGDGVEVAVTDGGPVFQLHRYRDADVGDMNADVHPSQRHASADDLASHDLEMHRFSATFLGAAAVSPIGMQASDATFNYFLGDPSTHRGGVPGFGMVVYPDLYDGIDLWMWAGRSSLKYEFVVAPGNNWTQVQVRYEGIEGLSINDAGELVVDVGDGWAPLVDGEPFVYQQIDGRTIEIDGRYVLVDDRTWGFEIGDYDPGHELVIDPDLAWSMYLGGGDTDWSQAVATDSHGNVVVAGGTRSAGWVSGGWDTGHNGSFDAFIVKLSAAGEHLWSTYLGGEGADRGDGIAVDSDDNILITGATDSPGWISGGFDVGFGGVRDAFAAKLSADGAHLWSTYLGGDDSDRGYGVAVDSNDNVLITGQTRSPGWVSGGWATAHNGAIDGFVVKLDADGAHLWSSYLGGVDSDRGWAIAVDGDDSVLISGDTRSPGWTSGGWQVDHGGDVDAFVVKLDANGAHLWSSYLGGADADRGYGIAVDGANHALVVGGTHSAGWVTGGWDTEHNGSQDIFIVKLDAAGGHLWSSYLGGEGVDRARAVTTDADGHILLTGDTASPGWAWRGGAPIHNGGFDVFVAEFDPDGAHLWSGYLGGSGTDIGYGIATHGDGGVLVTGETASDGFSGIGDDYPGGLTTAFVARLARGPVEPAAIMGIVGDSLSDEYFEDGYGYAWNWAQQLAIAAIADLGPTAQQAGVSAWGEPRRAGHEHNWARSGARIEDLYQQGQVQGLLAQIGPADITHVVQAIGANDFAPDSSNPNSSIYHQLYEDLLSEAEIEDKLSAAIDLHTQAMQDLLATGVRLVTATVPDYGIAPATQWLHPDPVKRERVTEVIREFNDRLIEAALDLGVPVADVFAYSKLIFGENEAPRQTLVIGGGEIELPAVDTVDNADPWAGFVHDGIHPHTTIQGALGQLIIETFNRGFDDSLPMLTEQLIVTRAGLAYRGQDTLLDDLGLADLAAFIHLPPGGDLLPGDANGDGVVDGADLAILLDNFGQSGQNWSDGDFTGDGRVGLRDASALLSNWGHGAATSSTATTESTGSTPSAGADTTVTATASEVHEAEAGFDLLAALWWQEGRKDARSWAWSWAADEEEEDDGVDVLALAEG